MGAETFEGVATRIDEWATAWHEINITSIRLGLGLGGSCSMSLFFAYHVNTLWEINNSSITDWGLNISIPNLKVNIQSLKVSLNLANYIQGTEFFTKAFIGSITVEKISMFRDLASFIYNSMELGVDNLPKLILLDVPGGWGAELSVFASGGEFNVGGAIAY